MSRSRKNHSDPFSVRNPVSYCIGALAVLFVMVSFGESPLLVMQHLLVPYTVDITRGVGKELAAGFRGVVLFLQIALLLLFYVVAKAQAGRQRTMLSVLGVSVACIYFFTIALGYVAPRLH